MIVQIKNRKYLPVLVELSGRIKQWNIDETRLIWYLNSMIRREDVMVLMDDKERAFGIFEVQIPTVEPVVNVVAVYADPHCQTLLNDMMTIVEGWAKSLGIKRIYARVMKGVKAYQKKYGCKHDGFLIYKEV